MNDDQRDRLTAPSAFEFRREARPERAMAYLSAVARQNALANGGFAGQGFLNGDFTQNGIVPYGFNDFIFVSIDGSRFLGCMAVILLLGGICFRCLQVARLSKRTAAFICVGIFAMIFTCAAINIGMCTSVLPVIGITLPFFSAGGTRFYACISVQVALNVICTAIREPYICTII